MGKQFIPDNVMLHEKLVGEVPGEFRQDIIKHVIENSRLMQLGRFVEMKDKSGQPVQKKKFTYLAEGPGAYWVGEAEKIKTSKPKWLHAEIETKKLGVIIPVSREFLYYSVKDFFNQMKPLIAEAFYKKFDEAAILGVDNPFTQSVEASIATTGQEVEGDITYENIIALEDVLLNEDIEGNAFVSKVQNRTALRKTRITQNGVLEEIYNAGNNTIDALPVVDLKSKALEKGNIYFGDWDYIHYGIPYTMDYQISTEATLSTITNEDNTDVNLFEQELVGLRATMDVALMITKDEAFAKLSPTPGA